MAPILAYRLHGFLIGLILLAAAPAVQAHGEMVWNDFTIDSKNDSIIKGVSQLRKILGDVVLGRREVAGWPDRELVSLMRELKHLQEEHELLLNHFRDNGVNILVAQQLIENPRAGRSVLASHALETAIALIEYVNSLKDPSAFEEDLHEDGKGAYIFDLMESQVDQMALYAALAKGRG